MGRELYFSGCGILGKDREKSKKKYVCGGEGLSGDCSVGREGLGRGFCTICACWLHDLCMGWKCYLEEVRRICVRFVSVLFQYNCAVVSVYCHYIISMWSILGACRVHIVGF